MFHELVALSRSEGPAAEGVVPVELTDFALLDKDRRRTSHIEGNDDVIFQVRIRPQVPIEGPVFSLTISTEAGMPVYMDNNWDWTGPRGHYSPGEEVVCEIRLPARLTTHLRFTSS